MADDPERTPSAPPPVPRPSELDPARVARWRRRTAAIFWGLAAIVSIVCSAQVAAQLFTPDPPSEPAPPCAEGLDRLRSSLDAAWTAARRQDDAPEHALRRFRAEVGPTWRHLPALQQACRGDAARSARLDALERLRYALEARVRVDGGSLAALRRRALGDSGAAGVVGDPAAPLHEVGGDEEGPEAPARPPSGPPDDQHRPSRPPDELPRPADDPSRNETR